MSNSFDQEAAQAIVEEIESVFEKIKSSQGRHMKYARECRDEIKEIYKSAKEDGLPEDVIKGLLKIRKANQEIHDVKYGMSPDYKPIFKPLAEALGKFADSPLGMAAADAEQREMFEEGENNASDDLEEAAAANQAAEQEEGEEILNRTKH